MVAMQLKGELCAGMNEEKITVVIVHIDKAMMSPAVFTLKKVSQ